MALGSTNNTNQSMARLLSAFSDAHTEIARIRNYYAGMRSEAQQSFDESKQFWMQKASDESGKMASMSGKKRAEVEEMIRGLDSLETQLCAVDKSYAKRRQSEYSIREHKSGEYDSSTDYYLKLKELHDEAVSIARECSLTVKAQPIQELGMLFSDKRKQKYERLHYLIAETKVLRKLVFSDLDEQVRGQNSDWNDRKSREIDQAALETAELIEAIDAKEKEEISLVMRQVYTQSENLLSPRDVSTLREMASVMGASNILSEECSEHILIGNLKIDLSEVQAYQDVSGFMQEYYAGCFSGTEMCLPAIYDLRTNFDICFDGHGNNEAVKEAFRSVIFSMLNAQPASRQTFVLSDPEGRAKGFDVFLDIAKQYNDIFGKRILATKDQIKDALREASDFVDEVGQTKLAGYADIFEYNSDVPDKQEPLRCLCFLNFPKYFDPEMLEDLLNIVKNGKSYGVQVLIGFDENELNERSLDSQLDHVSAIFAECIHLEMQYGEWKYANGVSVALQKAPSHEEMRKFTQDYSTAYQKVKDTSLLMDKILPEELFAMDATDRLEIPIGKNENGQIQMLTFGEGTSHHALVAGSTGSGKSTFLHTVIMSALMNYSPDELNLYLMDFKQGVEFKVYGEHKIPHIKLLALDAMQEFGQSILDELWEEIGRRSRLFDELKKQGMDIKDITDYRRMSGKKLPRILVIADEFQMMVSEEHNRKIANYCGGKLADFISLARVYGMHFLLATQTLARLNSGFSIRKSTINEMYIRIGLKCIESECNLMFGDKNGRSALNKMGSERGTAVYTGDYEYEEPIGFKFAYCSEDFQKELVESVEKQYSLMEPAAKTKVFVGSAVPQLGECDEFLRGVGENEKSLPVFLGEPIRIDAPIRINLNRIKRNNLLVVGGNQEMIDDLVALYMINVVRVQSAGRNRKNVYLFDGLTIIGESGGKSVKGICSKYPGAIRTAGDNFDVVKMIDELYMEFLDRKEKRQELEINAGNMIAVVINNMQWIETIVLMLSNRSVNEYIPKGDDRKSDQPSTDISALLSRMDDFMADMKETEKKDISNIAYGKKLTDLIENGYTCGIHFLMSVPDYISIKEYMYSTIPKFGNKILFELSNEDAGRVVTDAKTENLLENIVIYADGINSPYQIKPFSGIADYINQI